MPNELPPMPAQLERILHRVQGPGQYVGGEYNQRLKPDHDVQFRAVTAFPDAYELGMSYLGLRILYDSINRRDGWQCERSFAPWPDLEAELRREHLPLGTVETWRPLAEADLITFSLTYELGGTNLLNMLDLAGIPLRARKRNSGDPLILMGGHGVFNPEPFAPFADAILIGEAEDALPEILAILEDAGGRHADRASLLPRLAREVVGLYVPTLYRAEIAANGIVQPVPDHPDAPPAIERRIVHDFANTPLVEKPLVPIFRTAHERITLEIMRGCPNGCRFCQAGFACRPLRERSVATLVQAAQTCHRHTGFDEVGLLSLSTSDYSRFDELVTEMDRACAPLRVSLSLPSLRVDHALSGIPKRFKTVRKSGMTFAPEAGSDRLRAAINKDVTNENLVEAAREAFAQGWQTIKLYFMVGLPTETDEDAAAIAELANAVAKCRTKGGRGKPAVTLSASNFVPKAHTPFQWEPMATPETLASRQRRIQQGINRKRVSHKGHDINTSLLEGALARGDQRLAAVIEHAWRSGARFCGWSEHFRMDVWREAFTAQGFTPEQFAGHAFATDDPLPWDHIQMGVNTAFLRNEYEKARQEIHTPKCAADHCAGCGLNTCSLRDQ